MPISCFYFYINFSIYTRILVRNINSCHRCSNGGIFQNLIIVVDRKFNSNIGFVVVFVQNMNCHWHFIIHERSTCVLCLNIDLVLTNVFIIKPPNIIQNTSVSTNAKDAIRIRARTAIDRIHDLSKRANILIRSENFTNRSANM